MQKLKQEGVLVSGGRGYHGPEGEKGWARIGFAIPKNQLEAALKIMDKVFREEAALRKSSKKSVSVGVTVKETERKRKRKRNDG